MIGKLWHAAKISHLRRTLRRSNSFSWVGTKLSVRPIPLSSELGHHCLRLRYEVLHDELRWTHPHLTAPHELKDSFDDTSICFGIFKTSQELIAAGRLIILPNPRLLPSAKMLVARHQQICSVFPAAEISRLVVHQRYRHFGLFQALFFSSLLLARAANVRCILITQRDQENFAKFLAAWGFRRYADGFSYVDEAISPNEPAATYVRDKFIGEEVVASALSERENLLRRLDQQLNR